MFTAQNKIENILTGITLFVFLGIFIKIYTPSWGLQSEGQSFHHPSSLNIIDRRFEDRKSFPARSPEFYIKEHLRIILPALYFVLGFAMAFRFLGTRLVTAVFFNAIHLLFLLIALGIALTQPAQFLIIAGPVISSYIFASAVKSIMPLWHKLNIWFLYLCVQVILSVEWLSYFKYLNPTGFLIIHGAILLISFLFLKTFKLSLSNDWKNYCEFKNNLLNAAEGHPLLGILIGTMLFSIFWRILLIIGVPPNHSDSLSYQLPRIAYWMQSQSLHPQDNFNKRITSAPWNMEIMMLWTMISSRSVLLCGLIQFFSYLLSGSLLFMCLRNFLQIKGSLPLVVTLAWMALPENVLLSTAAENNICVAYFLMFSLLYFLLGNKMKMDHYSFISALALGLAIGTKVTALIVLFPFGIIFTYYALTPHAQGMQWIYRLILYFLFFLILGCQSYIHNFLYYGNFFTEKVTASIAVISEPSWTTFQSLFAEHCFNLFTSQTGLQFYLSIFADYYNTFSAFLGKSIFQGLHIPINIPDTYMGGGFYFNNWILKLRIHEDFAFFGLGGALILILSVWTAFSGAWHIIFKRKIKSGQHILFGFICIVYLVLISLKLVWDPWKSRLFCVFILFGSPLLVRLLQKNNGDTRLWMQNFLIIYSVIFIIPTTLMDEKKPLVPYATDILGMRYRPLNQDGVYLSERNIPNPVVPLKRMDFVGWTRISLNKDPLGRMFILEPYDETFVREYYHMVPPGSRVGVLFNFWQRQYPYFGPGLNRILVPLNYSNLGNDSFDYLIVNSHALKERPGLYRLIKHNYIPQYKLQWLAGGGVTLILRNKTPPLNTRALTHSGIL